MPKINGLALLKFKYTSIQMKIFSLIPLLISIPVLIAIYKGRLKVAFPLFLLVNVPTLATLIFDLEAGKFSALFFMLIIILLSCFIINKTFAYI